MGYCLYCTCTCIVSITNHPPNHRTLWALDVDLVSRRHTHTYTGEHDSLNHPVPVLYEPSAQFSAHSRTIAERPVYSFHHFTSVDSTSAKLPSANTTVWVVPLWQENVLFVPNYDFKLQLVYRLIFNKSELNSLTFRSPKVRREILFGFCVAMFSAVKQLRKSVKIWRSCRHRLGHLIKKITPELTPELTPEITPNYVN